MGSVFTVIQLLLLLTAIALAVIGDVSRCVQINFFHDHTKLIMCPLMAAVTFIDDTRESSTYRLSLIGDAACCSKPLWSRLRYAHAMVRQMINTSRS